MIHKKILRILFFKMMPIYNRLLTAICKPQAPISSDLSFLNDIHRKTLTRTDISDHLSKLFLAGLHLKNGIIVELGVRGGESTFVWERIAHLTDSKLISVDVEDCSDISSLANWEFVQRDDIEFAKEFEAWSHERNISSQIDILFIDTSHQYEHTKQEIASWFPFLKTNSKVIFHDTNVDTIFYLRKDRSMGVPGIDNWRGVIAALEDYFETHFDERNDFVDYRKEWLIRHYANSNGLTILEKMPLPMNNLNA